ncbi:MAG: putative HD phosphohydrolase [Crocinitomicaceae bacterium]|jgi:predicted HD phosphohydrolase
MFLKAYKYIGIFIIALVLLGHHSFQAQAMESTHHHVATVYTCNSIECHHEMNMEICEKIQGDKVQTSSQIFTVSKISNFVVAPFDEGFVSFVTFDNTSERIPISYQQLARSHLS